MTKHYGSAEFQRKEKGVGDRLDAHLELKSIMDGLAARDAEIKTFAEKAGEEIKNHGKVLDETKAALEKVAGTGVELQERLLVVEQKLARRGSGDSIAFTGTTPGKKFVESDEFKNSELTRHGRGRVRLELKTSETITSATSGAGGVGDAIVPHRIPGIVAPQDRPMTIRDLLAQGPVSGNTVEYVKETGFSNNAAAVAENPGSPKPKSDISFDITSTGVKTLAHTFKVSKQALDDVPQLAAYIDNRGRYGLRFVEEQQLLSGQGDGNNLLGLLPQATKFNETALSSLATNPTEADVIRLAMLQVRVAEFAATGIVMNPLDWAKVELLKSTDDDRYIWSSPRSLAAPGLWSLPIVETNSMPAGQFMVGAFAIAATVWDRQQAAVEIANQNEDDFVKNLLTIRIEERLALSVIRPESFVWGEFELGKSPLGINV